MKMSAVGWNALWYSTIATAPRRGWREACDTRVGGMPKRIPPYVCSLAFIASILGAPSVHAGQMGNITIAGTGTCVGLSGTMPLQVSSFPTKADDGSPTTTYKLSLLTQTPKAGLQNVVVTLVQSGDSETGHASLFNKTLFDGVVEGDWAGKFIVDKFSSFVAPSVKINATGCVLTLTDGLAVLAF